MRALWGWTGNISWWEPSPTPVSSIPSPRITLIAPRRSVLTQSLQPSTPLSSGQHQQADCLWCARDDPSQTLTVWHALVPGQSLSVWGYLSTRRWAHGPAVGVEDGVLAWHRRVVTFWLLHVTKRGSTVWRTSERVGLIRRHSANTRKPTPALGQVPAYSTVVGRSESLPVLSRVSAHTSAPAARPGRLSRCRSVCFPDESSLYGSLDSERRCG